jgi:pimeloyl-ACP methyl ester carboxylesterase
MGDDRTPFANDVMAQWVDAAAAIVEAQKEPVILVGHSRGTIIVSAVTERLSDLVARGVYLAGTMLADGEALMDVKAGSDEVFAAVVINADGTACGLDAARAPELFYGHCAPDVAARATQRLTIEPLQPVGVRLQLSHDRYGRVPRIYIETTDDRAIPLPFQREAQSRWPCERVVTLPSDHSPFYSMPQRLAEVLDELAQLPARV